MRNENASNDAEKPWTRTTKNNPRVILMHILQHDRWIIRSHKNAIFAYL